MNTVKHLLLTAVAVAWAGTAAWGQTPAKVKYRFIEAADLGVLGHISQTQNPYHRVDTTVYKGWTAWQNNQVRCSSGLSVAFRFPLVYDAMIFVTSLSMSVLFWPVLMAIMYEGKKTNMAGLVSMFVGGIVYVGVLMMIRKSSRRRPSRIGNIIPTASVLPGPSVWPLLWWNIVGIGF